MCIYCVCVYVCIAYIIITIKNVYMIRIYILYIVHGNQLCVVYNWFVCGYISHVVFTSTKLFGGDSTEFGTKYNNIINVATRM